MAHYQNQRQTWWGTAQHLISWTRATIVWLRNSWLLIPWVSYEITDHVQWRLVSWTTVTLLATSATELSHDARVNTTYDNTSWFWLYDIDTAIVYELHDNRANIVRWINWTEVANFDWWNTAYTNVTVDTAALTVTIWNTALITNVNIEKGSVVNLTWFTGTITNSTYSVASIANFTGANGTWRYNFVKDSWSFSVNWYTWGGDNYYNTITSSAVINFSNTASLITFRNNTVQGTVINNTWVNTGSFTINGSTLAGWNITHNQWALAFVASAINLFQSASISHVTGTLTITRVDMQQTATLNINTNVATTTITDTSIRASAQIINSSTTTLSVSRSIVESISNIIAASGSAWIMTVTDIRLFWSGSLQKLSWSTAGTLSVNSGTELDSSAFIYHNGTGNLTVSGAVLYGSSRVYVTSWNRSYVVTRLTGRNAAQITLNWTWAWIIDTIVDTDVDTRWVITMSATWATANNIQYCSVKWLSWAINVIGTSSWQTIQRVKAYDAWFTVNNCTVAMTHDMSFATSWWTITIQNLAVAKPTSYLTTDTWGTISITGTVAWAITRLRSAVNGNITISWVTWTVNNVSTEEWGVSINWWATHINITKRMNSTLRTGNFTTNNVLHMTNVNKTMTANNTARADYLWVVSSVPII